MLEVELLEEHSNWRARKVSYIGGNWEQIKAHIPAFELQDFLDKDDELANPYLKKVVRLPLKQTEKRMPVGVVSNTYTLAQHREVAKLCIEGIESSGIDARQLRCELGLSELGEWMNLRIYFPSEYDFTPTDENSMSLRLECFNSVDGSSRLTILFGWYRFVCSNGMIIGETVSEMHDKHNSFLDILKIKSLITEAMVQVHHDKERMINWENTPISEKLLTRWVDTALSEKWGKLAAFKTYHICISGHEAEYTDKFEKALPSQKAAQILTPVPGSPEVAKNLYDVAQALSWIATNRNNAQEKTKWQTEIPDLLIKLASHVPPH